MYSNRIRRVTFLFQRFLQLYLPFFSLYQNLAIADPRINPNRLSVLRNAKQSDVVKYPFPHVILRECLPEDIYGQLEDEYPTLETIFSLSSHHHASSNKRVNIQASKVLRENSTGISDLWIEFVKYHTSQSFFNEVVDIFGYDLERYRRDVPLKMGKSFQTLRTGVRNLKSRNKPDIVLDAQIAMNTPVRRQGTTVRGEHVDHLNEVYAGLLYFRSPDDTSSGGSLEILECVRGKTCKKLPKTDHRSRSWQVQFNPKNMRTMAEVPYEKNTLVMFVNGRTSYHRVSKRSQTMFPRRLVNLIGEYH